MLRRRSHGFAPGGGVSSTRTRIPSGAPSSRHIRPRKAPPPSAFTLRIWLQRVDLKEEKHSTNTCLGTVFVQLWFGVVVILEREWDDVSSQRPLKNLNSTDAGSFSNVRWNSQENSLDLESSCQDGFK